MLVNMLFYLPLLASLSLVAYAKPVDLENRNVLDDRETACIALDDCLGLAQPAQASSSSAPPPPPSSTAAPPPPPPSTAAQPPATVTGDVTAQGPITRIFADTDTCSNTQQKQINEAWNDAALLAKAALGGRYISLLWQHLICLYFS